MRATGLALFACCGVLARADEPDARLATIEFRVRVPQATPADANVWISGNAAAMGRWNPRGLSLKRQPDGLYTAEAKLPIGERVEFKLNRGGWESVERAADGKDTPNRTLTPRESQKLEIDVAGWADPKERPQRRSTLTGTIRFHEVDSKVFGEKRKLAVYLPPGYESQTGTRYPVFYLHDGQNLFDESTAAFGVEWRADEAAEALIAEKKIRPLIIVGVYNSGARLAEYTPTMAKDYLGSGKGNSHARFLLEEVKPFVDRTYRTNLDPRQTAVGGSSLGGLIALDLAWRHPGAFGLCAAVSPAVWWDADELRRRFEKDPGGLKTARIWIDMGTAEGGAKEKDAKEEGISESVTSARRLVEAFEKAGLTKEKSFRYLEVEGGQHNEAAWAARFPEVLKFLFPAGE